MDTRYLLLLLVVCGLGSLQGTLAQRSCYTCDSASDPNCATLKGDLASRACNNPDDECAVTVDGTRTIRGCATEIGVSCTEATCALCSDADLCNGIVYPEARLLCHRCTQCDKITNNGALEVCPNYDEYDNCYTALDVVNYDAANVQILSYRGCQSDVDEAKQACDALEADGKCQMCPRGGCNSLATYGQSTLSCIKCNSIADKDCGADHTAAGSTAGETCEYNTFLGEPEQCYTYIGENGIVFRGCLRELVPTNVVRMDCESGDPKCSACIGNNCNSADSTGYGTCISCDAYEDGNCATLEFGHTTTMCTASEETGCFRSEIHGAVVRGCVSALVPGEVRLCKAGSVCKICQGERCNDKVDFQRCYRCDSRTDPDCVNPQSAGTERTCSAYLDTCVAYADVTTGATVRGCAQELADYDEEACPGGTCVDCTRNYCNAAPIPFDRRKCHQCEGAADCARVTIETPKYCRNYRPDDQCYLAATYENGEAKIYRGCMSDEAASEGKVLCDALGTSCTVCPGDECNSAQPGAPTTLQCKKCDSDSDPTCMDDKTGAASQLCLYNILAGQPEHCYTHKSGTGKVVRGCLLEASAEVQDQCQAGELGCTICTGSHCNADKVESDGTCFFCDGTQDENCASMTGISPILCPAGEQKGCFRSQIDGFVVRGCASQLAAGEYNLCQRGQSCKLCEGDNCNGKINFQKCFSCDSASDPNCLNLQSIDTDRQITCSAYLDECVMYIVDGVTHRGCRYQSTLPDDCPSATCTYCSDESCNAKIFPSYRISCNKCSGTSGDACYRDLTGDTSFRGICAHYALVDACYSVVADDDSHTIHRGCLSDKDASSAVCVGKGDKCVECKTNGCNVAPAQAAPQLRCVACQPQNSECSWGYEVVDGQTCKNQVWLGDVETCYRKRNSDGTVERGCSLDNPTACTSGTCEKCPNSGCNVASYNAHKCYQCNSAEIGQETCAKEVEDIELTDCPGTDQQLTDIGCYMVQKDDGSVVRGCAKRLDPEYLQGCSAGTEEKCSYCDYDGCNNLPGAATSVTALSFLAVTVIAVMKVLIN